MNFPIPECDWSCVRIYHKWCDEHNKRIDFQVYLNTKATICSHHRQIRMHEDSKAFHPGAISGIDKMIEDSHDFIKKLEIQIKEFHNKYKEGW